MRHFIRRPFPGSKGAIYKFKKFKTTNGKKKLKFKNHN